MLKKCSKCRIEKDEKTEFNTNKRFKEKFRDICKDCFKKYYHSYYKSSYYRQNAKKKLKTILSLGPNNEEEKKYLLKKSIFRLRNNIRVRFRKWLNGFKKDKRTFEYLNCTKQELVYHLESLFQPGMTWENYGKWHVDHIKPLALFDPTSEEDMKLAWAKENLQPLWAKDNLEKNGNCRKAGIY